MPRNFFPNEPLGAADAASDIALTPDKFLLQPQWLETESDDPWDGLATCSVITGPTGAGKTRMLRIAGDTHERMGFVPLLSPEPPNTWTIERVDDLADTRAKGEYWASVWRAACVFSFVSIAITRCADETTRVHLTDLLAKEHLTPFKFERHPYAALQELAQAAEECQLPEPSAYFLSDRWSELLIAAHAAVPDCVGLAVAFDYLDQNTPAAPVQWHAALEGLLRLALTHDHAFANSVKVTVTVRAATFATIATHVRSLRTMGLPKVAKLVWTPADLLEIVDLRLRRLANGFQPAESSQVFGRITGKEQVTIPERAGKVEAIDDYVLRHCGETPRDVIWMGNALLEAGHRLPVNSVLPDDAIRRIVASRASVIGGEMLQQAATDLSADYPDLDSHNAVTGLRSLVTKLQSAVAATQFEVVSLGDLQAALADKLGDAQAASHAVDALWRARALSHRRQAGWATHSIVVEPALAISGFPPGTKIRFHSSLIDHAGLEPSEEV